ncbi:fibronectin type III domain-containing protein [Micromonospora tulbaghiae]
MAGEYIVQLDAAALPKGATVRTVAERLTGRHGGVVGNVYEQTLKGFSLHGSSVSARGIAADSAVVAVEQSRVVAGAETPWGLDRVDQRGLPLDGRFIPGGTGAGVTAYVVDSGVNIAHQTFQGRARYGRNFVDTTDPAGSGEAPDCSGHGTHVAGLIGGRDLGVATGASIVAVKSLGCDTKGTTVQIVNGIEWVASDVEDNLVRPAVLNISIVVKGTEGGVDGRSAVDAAVRAAVSRGITVVASAGNDDTDACGVSPARVPEVIAVGATNDVDHRWALSNHGSCVDIFAPGENVMSAAHDSNDGALPKSGTSMAAPHVAGAAALVLQEHPTFRPQQVRDTLLAAATKDRVQDSASPAVANRLLYLPPPDQPADTATNSNLNELFRSYGNLGGHWTGGDETMSVPLPDGRVAWFFGDTNLGTVNPDGSRPRNTPMIHNSIVIQQGNSLVKTLHGGTASDPKSLVGAETDGQPGDLGWWPGEAQVVNGKLQVFYTHVRSGGGGVLSFETADIGIATFTLPALTLESLTKLPALSRRIGWGTAMVDGGDGYTYIYGTETVAKTNYLHVARAPSGQVLGAASAPTAAWRFFTGSADPAAQWSADEGESDRTMTGVGTGFSVKRINGQFVLASFDLSQPFTNRLMGFFADRASGPFTHPTLLYKAPVPSGSAYVYNARLHPEQNGSGGFVVSYNVNSLDPEDLYRNVDLYRPKFVNVSLHPVTDRGLLPAAPTNVTVTDLAPGKVRLSWTPPAGSNLSYWIYERNAVRHATWFTRSQNPTTATSIDIGFLDPGVYELRVAAQNSAGEGPKSDSAWAQVTIPPPATAPTNVRATAEADGTVSLSWDAVSAAGWVNYAVDQRNVSKGETAFSRSVTATVTGTTARLTGLTHGDTYAFRVIASNGGGEGPPSAPVQVVVRIAPPGAPTGLTASPLSDGSISLSWKGPDPDRWYWVYSRDVTAGQSFTRNAYPVTSGTGTTVGGLTDGNTYEFYVVTIGANGGPDSAPSNTVRVVAQVAPPPPPTNLVGTQNDDGTIGLSWTAAEPDRWYWVYSRDVTAGGAYSRGEYPVTTGTSAVAGLLTHGHVYDFYVVAFNGGGESPPTNTVRLASRIAAPPPPANLRASARSDGQIDLDWDAAEADRWYWVYTRDVTAGGTFTRGVYPVTSGTSAVAGYLTVGHTYEFYVTTIGSGGGPDSSPSAKVQATAYLPPPSAPTNLKATAGNGQVSLSWTGPWAGAWFWLYTRDVTAGGSWQRSTYPITNGTSTVAGYLTNGHTYAFYVTTIGADGAPDSGPSNTVQATPRMPVPPAPTNLTATASSDGTIRLNWSSSGAGIWYWVYSRDVTAGGSFTRSKYPVSSGTTFTAGYLTLKHSYAFYVTAFNDGGESAKSNTAQATAAIPLPPAPGSPTTTKLSNGDIRLSWGSSGSGLWYYVYSRDVTAGESFKRAKYPVSSGTSFTAGYLKTNHTYAFYVRAINAMGEGPASSTVQAASTIAPPTNLTGQWTSTGVFNTARISWNSVNSDAWFYVWSRDVSSGGPWIRNELPVSGRMWQEIKPLERRGYEFKVTQAGNGDESAFSNTVYLAKPANPYAYTKADIDCNVFKIKLPRGGQVGWIELDHRSWGIAEDIGRVHVSHDILKNGQLFSRDEKWFTPAYDGSWSYNAPYHEVALGPAVYDLKVNIRGPNDEDWGRAQDTCLGS